MSRTTPEETFAEAREAMERGDWEGVFACLESDNLMRIGQNSVAHFMNGGDRAMPTFVALCGEHGVPDDKVSALRGALERMAEWGRAVMTRASDPAAMMQQSLRHRDNVKAYGLALKETLKAAPNLPAFTAALERSLGGVSVSSRLFIDEVVENVHIDGTKAWGIRRGPNGFQEDVGFVRKKGVWFIRLFGKRPK
jgi:hypothetical protein